MTRIPAKNDPQYQAYLERSRIANKKWREKNRGYWKQYAVENPEKAYEAVKRYRENNPDKKFQRTPEESKAYYDTNREYLLQYQRKFWKKNRVKLLMEKKYLRLLGRLKKANVTIMEENYSSEYRLELLKVVNQIADTLNKK